MSINRDLSAREGEEALLGFRFEVALLYAFRLHASQRRKGSNVPFIGHLLGVASIVIEEGGDEDQAIAALLHDAVEDQGGPQTRQTIRSLFGDRVVRIVDGCTDDVPGSAERSAANWPQRKTGYLNHLPFEEPDVLLVSLADKIYNARAILFDLRVHGDGIWSRFHHGKERQLWYYRGLAVQYGQAALAHLDLEPLAGELARLVDEIFRQCGERLSLDGGVGECPAETAV